MRVTQAHLVYGGLVTLLVVSAFILWVGYVDWSPINREAVARIKPGMTPRDVERILGGPCAMHFERPGPEVDGKPVVAMAVRIWLDRDARCTVFFDGRERVKAALFQEPPPLSPLERIKMWLRLR